jgi:hypothetical protein
MYWGQDVSGGAVAAYYVVVVFFGAFFFRNLVSIMRPCVSSFWIVMFCDE